MDFDIGLDDYLLFQLRRVEDAHDLWCLVRRERAAWVHHSEDDIHVVVSLRPDPDDLAVLLRTVEEWVGERGLPAVVFELDGRPYCVRAPARVAAAA